VRQLHTPQSQNPCLKPAAVSPIHLRARDAIFKFAAGLPQIPFRQTPGKATEGAPQQVWIAQVSPVLFLDKQSKSLAHGVRPPHTAFWPQNPLPVPFRVDVKQKQVELPLQFVKPPQVCPWHWVGVLEVVGDVGEVDEELVYEVKEWVSVDFGIVMVVTFVRWAKS